MKFFTSGAAILLLASFVDNAFSYTLLYGRWPSTALPLTYAISAGDAGFKDCEISAIQDAFDTWGSVKNSSLRFKYNGLTNETITYQQYSDPNFINKTNLLIKMKDLPSTMDWVAESWRKGDPGSDIVKNVNIVFNDTIDWTCGNNFNRFIERYHFESIALHEIGHFIGIGHPFNSKSVPSKKDRISVVQTIGPNEVVDKLYKDDEEAVRVLYPEIGKNNSSLAGTWLLNYDWQCAGRASKANWVIYNNGILIIRNDVPSIEGQEGKWTLDGNKFTLTFGSMPGGTQYKGKVTKNDKYMSGTMNGSDGGTGCWTATKQTNSTNVF